MNHGLPDKSFQMIIEAIARFDVIETAFLYGSRAMGNYKKGSDVDLAIKGENITYNTVLRLSSILNQELPLPYFFDVTHYESSSSEELKKHIDTEGVQIYSKSKEAIK